MQVDRISIMVARPHIDNMIQQYTGLGYAHAETKDDGSSKVQMIFEKMIPQNQAIPSNK